MNSILRQHSVVLRLLLFTAVLAPSVVLGGVPDSASESPQPDSSALAPASEDEIILGSDSVPPLKIPFKVGEKAEFDVKFGFIRVGKATMGVAKIEKVRNIDSWHTIFRLEGGTVGFRVKNIIESWIDTAHFASLRFNQTLDEGPRDRLRRYEIYPDKQVYTELENDSNKQHKSVARPLDDGSFLYFVRSVPLEVGKTYHFNNYFRPDRNPVTIKVLRKERIKVPAGTFDCIVVRPIIKTKGIFSENGQAEVWISDDDRRIIVQLKSRLSFGSINLYLKSYKAGK